MVFSFRKKAWKIFGSSQSRVKEWVKIIHQSMLSLRLIFNRVSFINFERLFLSLSWPSRIFMLERFILLPSVLSESKPNVIYANIGSYQMQQAGRHFTMMQALFASLQPPSTSLSPGIGILFRHTVQSL